MYLECSLMGFVGVWLVRGVYIYIYIYIYIYMCVCVCALGINESSDLIFCFICIHQSLIKITHYSRLITFPCTLDNSQ